MSKNESKPKQIPPLTIITLTLPEADSESKAGTLLVQSGDLARLHQFTYIRIADLSEIIPEAPPPKPPPTTGRLRWRIGWEVSAASWMRPQVRYTRPTTPRMDRRLMSQARVKLPLALFGDRN